MFLLTGILAAKDETAGREPCGDRFDCNDLFHVQQLHLWSALSPAENDHLFY
jgi:hypothetical protein